MSTRNNKKPKKDSIPTQTLTSVGKVVIPDDSTALLLSLVGFSATKLWNSALWHSKEAWADTGKILKYGDMDKAMKKHRWYRTLHAQSAQAVLEEQWDSYKSWFKRRKEDPKTKPPGFRRKDSLSTVTFKKDSISWNPFSSELRIGVQKSVFDKKYLYLKIQLPPKTIITSESVQLARIVYEKGQWLVHLVRKIPLPKPKKEGRVMSLDLGIRHLAAWACSDGFTRVYSGGELRALERYFEKEKSKCTDVFSNKRMNLESKRSRQRNHLIHVFTRSVINDAIARGVTTITVGKLKDIRNEKNGEAKNWGASGNQDLHKWPYKKIFDQLKYKGALQGITVIEVSERYSSQTCSSCGKKRKANRVHRGLYVCKHCGATIHADVNGAINMLKKYLLAEGLALPAWSSGCLAKPVVNRFAWRKTKPLVREPGTFAGVRQHSSKQLQTARKAA